MSTRAAAPACSSRWPGRRTMSSGPRIRSGRRRRSTALLVLLVVLAVLGAPGAAAQPAFVVVPGGTANGQVRLLAQVPDGAGDLRSDAFSLSVGGVPQPARAEPVLSDRLAMALVV